MASFSVPHGTDLRRLRRGSSVSKICPGFSGVKRPTIQGNLDIFNMSRLGSLLGYWVDS